VRLLESKEEGLGLAAGTPVMVMEAAGGVMTVSSARDKPIQTVLSGPAGGGNVNRWRGQIGLPPMDEAARARARESVRAKVGEVSLYDFVSGGELQQRMLAGLLLAGDQTWFFKLTGGAAAVGAAKPDFVKLLASLRTTGA